MEDKEDKNKARSRRGWAAPPLKRRRRKLPSKAESSPDLFFSLRLHSGSGFRCVSISLSLARKKTQQQHHVYLLSLLVFYSAPFLYPLPLSPTSDSLPLIGGFIFAEDECSVT